MRIGWEMIWKMIWKMLWKMLKTTTGGAIASGACLLPGLRAVAQVNDRMPPEPPPTVSVDRRLRLEQAVALAERQNPLILAAAHQKAGARANYVGQSAPINPTLNVYATSFTPDTFDPADPTKFGFQFPIEISGRQRWRSNQARAQLLGVYSDAETTRLVVRQAATGAYIDMQVANTALANEQEAYSVAKRLSDLTEKQVQNGAAPEVNAIRARIAVTQEEQNLWKAIGDVRLARAALNIQIGRPPTEPIDAADALQFALVPLDPTELLRAAERARPELRSAEQSRKALQATLNLQRSQYYPDLIIGMNFRAASQNQVQVGFTMPLFDYGSIRGQVRKAREDIKTQEAQILQVRQTVRLDVETAIVAATRARRIVETFQDGILPRSESLLKRVEQGYTLGASTILDLIDAQQTLRATRNAYYAAIGDYRRALAQIERATSTPLRGGLFAPGIASPARPATAYAPLSSAYVDPAPNAESREPEAAKEEAESSKRDKE